MAGTVASALGCGALLAAAPSATAGDGGRVSAGGAIAGGTAAGDGWLITGVTSHGSAFLGPMADPLGGPDWVWCINVGLKPPSGSVSVQTVSDANSAAMAWLLDKLQYDPASLGVADRGLSNAAGSFMAHMVYEEGNKGGVSAEARKAAIQAAAWPALRAEADRLWATAQASVTRTAQTEVQTYDIGGQRSGVISNIGIRNGSGAWLPGVDFTAYLDGNAVFDTNNNNRVDPGETNTYTGLTQSTEVHLNWVATSGVGDPRFHAVYATTQAGLNVLRASASMQDTLRRGGYDPMTLTSAGVQFRAVGSFQPVVSTRVASEMVDAGDLVPDAVTFAAAEGEEWIPGTAVRADGVLYGPFESPQPASNAVPAGVPVAATASVSVSAPGTVTGGANVAVPASGFYTWVWSIDKETQPDPDLITADFSDGFFTVGETSIARLRMDLSSDVATASEFISKGEVPVDEFSVGPVVPGDLWLAPSVGDPVGIAMIAEISEPVSEAGLPVEEVVQTIRFTADRYGTYTTGVDTPAFEPLEYSGVYSVRLSVDTEALDEQARHWLDDDYEAASDGWWAPNEVVTVRMDPRVVTERQDRILEERDLPAPLVDDVTISLADEQDLWLTRNGQPVGVPVVNDAYGPYDVPRPQVPDPFPQDAPLKVGTETVTFTGPGTQATPGGTVINPDNNAPSVPDRVTGFYTWESKITTDPLLFDAFDSDFWIESETTTVRDEVVHWSRTLEPDLVPGGRLFDDVRIEQLRGGHGTFEGLQGTEWLPDDDTARLVVYGPLTVEPTKGQYDVPEATPVFDSVEFEAVNGQWEFGYDDLAFERVPLDAPIDPETGEPMREAWFQFVYEFDGDDRTTPYASGFDDQRERAYVSWSPTTPPPPAPEPEPGAPGLVTQAQVLAADSGEETSIPLAGDSTRDVLRQEGEVAFDVGSTAVSDLYFAPVGEELVCTSAQRVFSSAVVDLTPDQVEYVTDSFVTPALSAGTYGWREMAWGPGGDLLDIGACGEPAETFEVLAVRTTIGHEDTNGDGLAGAGDELWDDIHLEGGMPDGAEVDLASTVYELTSDQVTWGDAAINTGAGNITVPDSVCTDAAVFTTLAVTEAVTEPGVYATDRFNVPGAGERVVGGLTMVETATVRLGEESRTLTGICGTPEESIGPVYFGSGGGGELAVTGVSRLAVMLLLAVALATTGGALARWSDRRNRSTRATA